MEYYHEYKGIWYKYIPKDKSGKSVWSLSDRSDMNGNVMVIDASKYRLDQCIEMYLKFKNGV